MYSLSHGKDSPGMHISHPAESTICSGSLYFRVQGLDPTPFHLFWKCSGHAGRHEQCTMKRATATVKQCAHMIRLMHTNPGVCTECSRNRHVPAVRHAKRCCPSR